MSSTVRANVTDNVSLWAGCDFSQMLDDVYPDCGLYSVQTALLSTGYATIVFLGSVSLAKHYMAEKRQPSQTTSDRSIAKSFGVCGVFLETRILIVIAVTLGSFFRLVSVFVNPRGGYVPLNAGTTAVFELCLCLKDISWVAAYTLVVHFWFNALNHLQRQSKSRTYA